MDPLSLLPALAWLVLPALLGLGFRWLAGDDPDGAGPILSALLTTAWPDPVGHGIREPEVHSVPVRCAARCRDDACRGRTRPNVRQPSPV